MSESESSSALWALSTELAAAVDQASQVVVAVNGRRRFSSSGVHWQPNIIVTADHTIKREEELSVSIADRSLPATLVGRDPGTDLALLRVENSELPTASLADVGTLQVGQFVMAIARSQESGVNASFGVISALGGSWRTWHGRQIDQFIRPDLSLYPGFSGGALVNLRGQVIGINTAGPRGMTMTIPIATVNRVVEQLVQRGRIARGYLGVGMQAVQLPSSLTTALPLDRSVGVIIVSVEPDSPAEQAGVLIGDILVNLGGQATTDVRDIYSILEPERIGQAIAAQVIRGGALVEVTIVVGERPLREVRKNGCN